MDADLCRLSLAKMKDPEYSLWNKPLCLLSSTRACSLCGARVEAENTSMHMAKVHPKTARK